MTLPDRNRLIRHARETIRALESRAYDGPDGTVDLRPHLNRAQAGTQLLTPEQLHAMERNLQPGKMATRFSITRETTLAAGQRLLTEGPRPVSVLNFASATIPGGGFLTGSAAQEESLCRASGLYATLKLHPEYYDLHQGQRLYTDHLMFAPDVPVFRAEDGDWLPAPYHVDVLTAAAPNLRGLNDDEYQTLVPRAQAAIERRACLALSLFREAGCERLVLGAWGCGAFRNDPVHVAQTFCTLLTTGTHRNAFREVVFAVFAMPWEETNLHAFQQAFVRHT